MTDTSWMVWDYPEPTDEEMPHCPICGEPTSYWYMTRSGEVVGCPECIEEVEAELDR